MFLFHSLTNGGILLLLTVATLSIILCIFGWFLCRWILQPYFEWKYYSNHSKSDSIVWNSEGVDSEKLTSYLFRNPCYYLSVILPAFNEEFRLPYCLADMLQYLKTWRIKVGKGFTYEIIIVDDGSSDQTVKVAQEFRLRESPGTITIVSLKANRGKGFAVQTGMCCARGKYLLMADSDGATRFSDFERLENVLLKWRHQHVKTVKPVMNVLTAAETGKKEFSKTNSNNIDSRKLYSISFGSRKDIEQSAIARRSFFRNFLMYGFHFCVKLMINTHIKDTQCGFKMFDRLSARWVFGSLHLYRWAFDTEIVILADILGLDIAEIAVNWEEIPGSKLNVIAASLQMARDMLLTRVLYGLNIWQPNWDVIASSSITNQ